MRTSPSHRPCTATHPRSPSTCQPIANVEYVCVSYLCGVLVDRMLPHADGVKLMDDILEVAVVLALLNSAYGMEELIARAFDHGAADWWSSPSRQLSLRRAFGRACAGVTCLSRWSLTHTAT